MSEKLKIISLGGLNEIGKNLTVYESGGDILVVDCGIAFPDDETLGIDLIIPDMSYLEKHRSRVRGLVITHGHEDHIGGIPFFLKKMNVPIYTTRLAAGLIEIRLEEQGMLSKTKINRVEPGDHVKVGCFDVEFIHVNHSIADACSLCITTPLGKIVHTGDFKIDSTPVHEEMMDLGRLGELGKEGVLALLSDSTNAERPGYAMSERKVGESYEQFFKNCDKRIIITTFASNVHRIQQIINVAVRHGRKVAITGRSMENILKIAIGLNYLDIPPNTIIEMNQVRETPKNKVVVITTGSQGEPMSALYRMAFSDHRQIEVGKSDRIIISASPIPGNEKLVYRVINELFRKGAEVVYEKLNELHVSGHACQEELKIMLGLTKPKYFMPIHGEHRHLRYHANLAKSMGIPESNIFISEIGRVLEFSQKGVRLAGTVPSGRVFVDGLGVGDVGSVVLRDRKLLSNDGLIVVVMTLSAENGSVIAGPDIVSRGFIYVKEAEDMMEEMRGVVVNILNVCAEKKVTDWATIKSSVKNSLSDHLYKRTKRTPMILPVLMEI